MSGLDIWNEARWSAVSGVLPGALLTVPGQAQAGDLLEQWIYL